MLPCEVHLPAPGEDIAQWCSVGYVDEAMTRREILRTSEASDTYLDWRVRISKDNGRSWSSPTPLPDVVVQHPDGGLVTVPGGVQYEPCLGILYEQRMRRLWAGLPAFTFDWADHNHPFTDHCFVIENGQERLLQYEDGPNYDPERPFDPYFDRANRAYWGVSMALGEDGSVWYPLVCRPAGHGHTTGGVVLLRRDAKTGVWSASNQQFIDPQLSSRGLLEPDVALLKNGHLLVVMRGSNTETTPGHKWFSVSTDGGKTLSPVDVFKYDDGSRFYSPSSIHNFIRSTRNGKLYWIANIVPNVPDSNSPRYPLYVAEIDEEKVAVSRGSLVLVADRREQDSTRLQLSNFSVIENRETLDIEIYLTRIGEHEEHFWQAGVYRYVFSPPL